MQPLAQLFKELGLEFVIYDIVSLCWTRKLLIILHNKWNLGFVHPKFVLNIYIFQSYFLRALISEGVYFDLTFWIKRKLLFPNDAHNFKRNMFIRNRIFAESLNLRKFQDKWPCWDLLQEWKMKRNYFTGWNTMLSVDAYSSLGKNLCNYRNYRGYSKYQI